MSAEPVGAGMPFPTQNTCPEYRDTAVRSLLIQPWCQKCPNEHDLHPGCPDDGHHPISHDQEVARTYWYTLTMQQIDDPTQAEPGEILLDVYVGNDLWSGEPSELAADLVRADEVMAAALAVAPRTRQPDSGGGVAGPSGHCP